MRANLLFSVWGLGLILLALSSSGCWMASDLAYAAVQGRDESYSITDTKNFPAPKVKAYYRKALDEVGQEMGFRVISETPEGFTWEAESSNMAEEYFLGKYKGTYVSATLIPAHNDNYEPLEGYLALNLSLSATGNYRKVSREDIKPLFEEIQRRFSEHL
jgi:hypothetical protein